MAVALAASPPAKAINSRRRGRRVASWKVTHQGDEAEAEQRSMLPTSSGPTDCALEACHGGTIRDASQHGVDPAGYFDASVDHQGLPHLLPECVILVLLFRPGHDRRALSCSLKDRLDIVRPVCFIGPPKLPAKATCREVIGSARAGFNYWVPTHKTVSLFTCRRQASNPRARWDSTVLTTSSVSFGQLGESKSPPQGQIPQIRLETAGNCWKSILRFLHHCERGTLDRTPGAIVRGRGLCVRFGEGPELNFDYISRDLAKCIEAVELEAL
eukprot:TRINITY_DN50278_c0_g1_i1.p1 TRINITY_DN50278_c0_g1~~TRINITY_DN50278_c0_g1_i1.p1  ORF type:complete len:271 (-),score=28.25 TRINITY_DN50278_c0_g1_i1:193-1005(-)